MKEDIESVENLSLEMKMLKHFYVLPLVLCIHSFVYAEPQVDIFEFYGSVILRRGKTQIFQCEVTDPVEGGVFTWKIGEKEFTNSNGFEKVEDDVIRYTLEVNPIKEFNGEDLSCEYSVGKKVYSDSLTLMVFDFSVSGEKIFAPEVGEGERVKLKITATIFPAPRREDITWNIKYRENVTSLHPGRADPSGSYRAYNMQKVEEDQFLFELEIASVDETEMSKQHSITIATTGGKKKVDFILAMRKNQEPQDSDKTEKPALMMMSNNMIIIIVVIVIVIIAIIIACYFCTRKKKDTVVKNNKEYHSVNVKDTNYIKEDRV